MLCQLQNGVISDGDNKEFRDREDLTLHSQREAAYQVHNINPRDLNYTLTGLFLTESVCQNAD